MRIGCAGKQFGAGDAFQSPGKVHTQIPKVSIPTLPSPSQPERLVVASLPSQHHHQLAGELPGSPLIVYTQPPSTQGILSSSTLKRSAFSVAALPSANSIWSLSRLCFRLHAKSLSGPIHLITNSPSPLTHLFPLLLLLLLPPSYHSWKSCMLYCENDCFPLRSRSAVPTTQGCPVGKFISSLRSSSSSIATIVRCRPKTRTHPP